MATTTNNNNDDKKKKKRRSIFSEVDDLEKRLAAARERADNDRANSLTAQNAEDDFTRQLLSNAIRQMFEKVDKEQNGNFILGSMSRLSGDMWKKVI